MELPLAESVGLIEAGGQVMSGWPDWEKMWRREEFEEAATAGKKAALRKSRGSLDLCHRERIG